MKKYESYKSTKIEFLDAIPEHWEEKRLRFLGYLYGGLTGKSAKDFNQPDNDDNKYFIPFTNIAGNLKINPDQLQHVVIEEDEKQNEVKVGDLFFLMSSEDYDDVGRSAVLTEELTETYLNSFCKGLRLTSSEIYPEYLNYHLHSKQLRHNLLIEANGFTRINLKVGKVQDLYVAFPNKPEQTAIATYLDRKTTEIDELIADKKRLLEFYEEEKTTIINQAVTKGINPDAPMKDSGIEWLGEIPKNWRTSPLKYLGKFINGFSFKSTDFVSTGVRVLKISNIQHMRIDWSDESFIDETFYETHENFRVLENDLVFALTRPIISTGIKVALIDTTEPILLNQRNSIYRPTYINVKWVYYILLSSNFIQEFDSRIDKTGQQPNISSNDIGEIKITIPNEDEQNEIISFIDKRCSEIDAKKAKTEKLIELLNEYRQALISEVVTGQIKVTD